jgi:hypothetical protein
VVLLVISSHRMLASPELAGWPLLKSNEAESGSLSLRLTRSPFEASSTAVAHCQCSIGYMSMTNSHGNLLTGYKNTQALLGAQAHDKDCECAAHSEPSGQTLDR